MKELAPLDMLKGKWTGKGKGTYGPFHARVDVKTRGRWLLMRQEITLPIVGVTTYVSTQVYGFDDSGLTLDFFDTAGAFRFHGVREDDTLRFDWHDGPSRKTSRYWKEGDQVRFAYQSIEVEPGSKDRKEVTFEGVLEPAKER